MLPQKYLRVIVTEKGVRYNLEYTHTKDCDDLPVVHACLRFWNCDNLSHTEPFAIEMKNAPNQPKEGWKVHFMEDDDDVFTILMGVCEIWDVPTFLCPTLHENTHLKLTTNFEEGEYFCTFYQGSRKAVVFSTVYYNREGWDVSGKMLPQGLKWIQQ